MKILKFNETFDYKESDYKEYDEYATFNKNITEEWKHDLNSINNYLSDLRHDFHQYNDFIREYVIFDENKKIIANRIELNFNDEFNVYFYDDETKKSIRLDKILKIQNIDEIAENIFLELYDTYIVRCKANYMDIFGKEEFKHILDAEKKYNL